MKEEIFEAIESKVKYALKKVWKELPDGKFNVDIEIRYDDIAVWCINAELEEGGEE